MDMKMNQIAKLDVIPSGRRIAEQTETGEIDWKTGPAAQRLLVAKINQIIDEVNKLQHIAMATSSVLAGATMASEGGDDKTDRT